MTIHPPKLISSKQGLGFNTLKTMQFVSKNLGVGTELWEELNKPWQESGVIIANPGYKWVTTWEVGKRFVMTKILNHNNIPVGIYCDICRPVRRTEDGFEFEDLYLDVWQEAGNKPKLLDADELDLALQQGYVSKKDFAQSQNVAIDVLALLTKQM